MNVSPKGSLLDRLRDGPLVCLGDSITASGWPEMLPALLAGILSLQAINAGIRGNTSTQGLRRLERDVLRHAPGVVVVEFGLNDCNFVLNAQRPRVGTEEFASNLQLLGRLIRVGGAEPLFIVNHRTLFTRLQPDGRTYEEHSADYSAEIIRAAEEIGAAVLNMRYRFSAGDAPDSAISWAGPALEDLLAEDGIHLSPAGVVRYAKLVADYLLSE
jgi:lysophospholipase L1-like esterase